MKLEISLGMAYKAKRAAGRREPLRTVSELADESGVTKEGLERPSAAGRAQPVFNGKQTRNALKAKWFKPSEVPRLVEGRTC